MLSGTGLKLEESYSSVIGPCISIKMFSSCYLYLVCTTYAERGPVITDSKDGGDNQDLPLDFIQFRD